MAPAIVHEPARVLRPVTVPDHPTDRVLPPGTPVLASRWGGQVYVLWHGADVPVEAGAVMRVATIEETP